MLHHTTCTITSHRRQQFMTFVQDADIEEAMQRGDRALTSHDLLRALKDHYQALMGKPWPTALKAEKHTAIASLPTATGLDPLHVAHLQHMMLGSNETGDRLLRSLPEILDDMWTESNFESVGGTLSTAAHPFTHTPLPLFLYGPHL